MVLCVCIVSAGIVIAMWKSLFMVEGISMEPELLPGDWVVTWRPWLLRRPREGDVVLLVPPGGRRLWVKRVTRVWEEDGCKVWVEGSGSASIDSRTFGALPAEIVKSHVIAVVWPVGRIHVLRRDWSGGESASSGR